MLDGTSRIGNNRVESVSEYSGIQKRKKAINDTNTRNIYDVADISLNKEKKNDIKGTDKLEKEAVSEFQKLSSVKNTVIEKAKAIAAGVEKYIFMDDPAAGHQNDVKRQLIDSIMEDKIRGSKREVIYQRLEKFPENALRIISKSGVKILDKPLNSKEVKGVYRIDYRTEKKEIKADRAASTGFFYKHRHINSLFTGVRAVALGGVAGAGISSALMFSGVLTGLPLIAAIIGSVIIPMKAGEKIGSLVDVSSMDVFEHEAAHALDYALGRMGKYRNLPADSRVDASHVKKTDIPFSLKSSEIINSYLGAGNGKKGSDFVTDYAGTNPRDYFAESVMAYLSTENYGSFVHREDLLKKDPRMYKIIEKLFQDISKGSIS